MLNMEYTLKFCFLAFLLGLSSAATLRAEPKTECWFQDRYCDTSDKDHDVFILTDDAMDDTEECYNQCFAEKGLAAPAKPCLGFTLRTVRGQHECQLLREPCVANMVDACIAWGACVSGPSDCNTNV